MFGGDYVASVTFVSSTFVKCSVHFIIQLCSGMNIVCLSNGKEFDGKIVFYIKRTQRDITGRGWLRIQT